MSSKNKPDPAVAAFRIVRSKVSALANRIKAATGDNKIALEKEMKELMDSIGMNYTGVQPDPVPPVAGAEATEPAEPTTIGGRILFNLNQAEADLNGGGSEAEPESIEAEQLFEAPSNEPVETLSMWKRFKNWVGRNKVTLLVSAAALAAAGGAAYYFTRGAGASATTSTVSSMAEAATEAGAESTSILSSIGQFFVRIGAAIKGYAVAAYTWVINLFTKASAAADAPATAAA